MTTKFETALIIGAGRGTGRALAPKLAEAGTKVTAVARTASDLETLASEHENIITQVGDGAAGIATGLLEEIKPDLLVLAGGISPKMSSFQDQSWEEFSATWNADTKTTFDFLKFAVTLPMSKGGTIVTLSSGAAISGSRLSGGYAGAKRMQHYLTNYAAGESDKRELGLRCYTIYTNQFIAGTKTADIASRAYAEEAGMTQAAFMARWAKQVTPESLADRVLELVDPDAANAPGAWTVTGEKMEPFG
ncbi:SDR family oxidoreductase [uncultured Tateyamaria sp.]|uniref:SDR family NAD(P)-dependent oxidoreductase n=1 Tax=uncultured Tateyamaria sp. TaxID=455651 RepID=UPI002602801C|nr:SDR family oxidoreductase [uncultured Tateyamaria sp.]